MRANNSKESAAIKTVLIKTVIPIVVSFVTGIWKISRRGSMIVFFSPVSFCSMRVNTHPPVKICNSHTKHVNAQINPRRMYEGYSV